MLATSTKPCKSRRVVSKRHCFGFHWIFRLGCVALLGFAVTMLIQEAARSKTEQYEGNDPMRTRFPKSSRKKSRITTIKSVDGDVVDCIDIYQQPAFHHPLLRNHKIQMKPGFRPKPTNASNGYMVDEVPEEWRLPERCPAGTIPKRRTPRRNLRSVVWKAHAPIASDQPENNDSSAAMFQHVHPHEHAVVYTRGGKYFGAKASINVWKPRVEADDEFSLAQIWVLSESHLNSIEAGWTVHPTLYGDRKTRFFVFWTSDHYGKMGCYNLMCPGFVQTNNYVPLGFALKPISTYGGPQYYINLEIFMDKYSGNWWLFVQGRQMGYWPGELLPALATGAKTVEWGGEVVNSGWRRRHTKTEMGSGRFPVEGFRRSSFFRDVKVVDEFHTYRDPAGVVAPLVDRPECYDVRVSRGGAYDGGGGDEERWAEWGTFFYYGGPGSRSSYCP